MSFVDINSDPAEVTLYAIVRYDHAAGQHRIVGVQATPVTIVCSETPSTPLEWSIHSVDLGLPVSLFEAAWNSGLVVDNVGSVALSHHVTANADSFVNNSTATLNITVPNTTGDGTFAEVHELTVHLRAISSRELLPLSGGNSVVLGSGSVAASGMLAASAVPSSTELFGVAPWNDLFWRSTTAGATFTPSDSTTSTEVGVGGVAGTSIELQLAADNATPATDVRALFDGSSTVTFPGSAKTFDCGDSDLAIVANSGGPTVTLSGINTEIGAPAGGTTDINFQLEVSDTTYFSLDDVTITISFVPRNGVAAPADIVLTHTNGVLSAPGAVTDVTFTIQQPTVADANKPPIDSGSWPGLYGGSDHSASIATWGDGTAPGNFQIQLNGRYEEVTITVDATNHAGEATQEITTVYVSIPTEAIVVLDYSGSMSMSPTGGGGPVAEPDSRWNAARGAANRFHAIYQALAPAIGGASPLVHRVGYVRYWWNDTGPVDETAVAVPLVDVTDVAGGAPAAGTLVTDGLPAWLQWTPTGSGVLTGFGAFGSGDWRRRTLIVLTDGYENRGPVRVSDILTAVPADAHYIPPANATNPMDGLLMHTCAFGASAAGELEMQNLATAYGGQFHSTTTSDPNDVALSKDLTNKYLTMLTDTVGGVNKLPHGDVLTHTLSVEPGVDRAVIVITSDEPATLVGPAASSALEGVGGASAAGIRYWTLVDPNPAGPSATTDIYSVSMTVAPSAGDVELHGVLDLQLRASFSVEGAGGVGQPLTLKARITDGGKPVVGANVVVKATGPGLSEGSLLERASIVDKAAKTFGRVKGRLRGPDVLNRRSAILDAAEQKFGFKLAQHKLSVGGIRLKDVPDKPGYYEATFLSTTNEGAYTFDFSADGTMLGGATFERAYTTSRYLEPLADPLMTDVQWVPGPANEKLQSWTINLKPITLAGTPLGSGRNLSIQVAGQNDPVALADRLDGTYSATLQLDPLEPLPAVTFIDGLHRVELAPSLDSNRAKFVRVILEQVRIKEAHESFGDPGEIHFDAIVAPGGRRSSAVRQRVPEQGVLKLADGDRAVIKKVLFEGSLVEGDNLLIQIGASEHDAFPSGDEREEKLVTYRRTLRGPIASWVGSYSPDKKKDDPESMGDWDVWYSVQVL